MHQPPRLVAAAVLLAAAWFAHPLVAQVSSEPEVAPGDTVGDDALSGLKLADVQAELAAIEADSGLDATVKDALRAKYLQAIDALNEAAALAAKAQSYREAVDTSPDLADQMRAELQTLPSADRAAQVQAPGNNEDLQKDVASRRTERSELNDDLSKATGALAGIRGRPVELSSRLPEAQRELSEILQQLTSPKLAEDSPSRSRVADRILLQAGGARLQSELEMLKQDQLSLAVRENLLQAQQELLTRKVENASATLATLEAALQQRLKNEAKQVATLVDAATQDLSPDDAAAQELAADVKPLAQEFKRAVNNAKHVQTAQDDVALRLSQLKDEQTSIRQQLKFGSAGGAMSHVLLDLERRILDSRADSGLTVQLPNLEETRLAVLEIAGKLRQQEEVEQRFADHSNDAVVRLVNTRREVLQKLQTQYRNLTASLAALQGEQSQYRDKADEVLTFTRERLFWMRSSPPLSAETLTDIPDALRWALARDHWQKLGYAVRWIAKTMPLRSVGVLLVAATLLLLRHQIGAALARSALQTRRISTDRYSHTLRVSLWTLLLAVPVPMLLGFSGWALARSPEPSEWLLDAAFGLRLSAWVILVAGFLAAACRVDGLGAAHFGWRTDTLAQLRRAIFRFTVVYVPALLLISYRVFGGASQYFDSVGRVSFMLAHAWTALVLWQLFYPPDGILDTLARHSPNHVATRWRYLWFPLVLACPLAVIVLAAGGYVITAVELSVGLLATVALIAGGVFLYALVLRWFTIKQRKLALAEALERRRAQREAAAETHEHESGEVVSVDPEEEDELDLDASTQQTRHLLRMLFGLGVALAIIVFWSGTVPLLAVFSDITVPLSGGRSLLTLSQAALIGIITLLAVKDLPGLLELAVLRTTSIEAGTRYAVSTLCQYAVTAVGLALIFSVLEVDWAKLGWIAAALSVGLGFGLQEVVANFVCGLVLLFERPIRVGDVVTVENITGTVTRIRMRATTVTNWDRQEFVVPNKNLITGTILNWTLTAAVNRIVIPVGVAYGTDTEQARQILLDVATDHPLILADPAPLATFEQFADSSQNLKLYAYLPDLDSRLRTTTELHAEIAKRFAAAGIEIAFPQLDLHLRSGADAARAAGTQRAGNGKKEAASGKAPPFD